MQQQHVGDEMTRSHCRMLGLNLVISLIITMMLLGMGMMYPNKKLNLLLYGLFALVFMRGQAMVDDRQFLRAISLTTGATIPM